MNKSWNVSFTDVPELHAELVLKFAASSLVYLFQFYPTCLAHDLSLIKTTAR
jgi:hypothetical protein